MTAYTIAKIEPLARNLSTNPFPCSYVFSGVFLTWAVALSWRPRGNLHWTRRQYVVQFQWPFCHLSRNVEHVSMSCIVCFLVCCPDNVIKKKILEWKKKQKIRRIIQIFWLFKVVSIPWIHFFKAINFSLIRIFEVKFYIPLRVSNNPDSNVTNVVLPKSRLVRV